MSIVAALALAASAMTVPQCSWDRPGVNPFMGDVVAAVDRYKDIPATTRAKLKERMQKRQYDEVVEIRRDGIRGKASYDSDIRDMHFGAGSVCTTVTRAKWSDKMLERGLVYCEDGQCILVPTVCRNVSRITRKEPMAATPVASAAREGDEPESLLEMDPTGAGVPSSSGAPSDAGASFEQILSAEPSAAGVSTPTFSSLSSLSAVPALSIGTLQSTSSVTPTTVPEPESWALMLAGLATVGWIARRRQRGA